MKEKFAHLEKIIFFVLLGVLLFSLPVLFKSLSVNNDIIDQKIQSLTSENSEKPSKALVSDLALAYPPLAEKPARELAALTSKRNIFTQQAYDENKVTASGESRELLVNKIGLKPLGIEYRGKVFFKDDDRMLAQVNVHKKSYLVKKGTKFASYKVHELNGESIEVTDKKGEVIKIKYREKAYTNELAAQIKELISGYSKTVTINDTFLEYKVLDIDENSVLLSLLGQHLRLEKGMVLK